MKDKIPVVIVGAIGNVGAAALMKSLDKQDMFQVVTLEPSHEPSIEMLINCYDHHEIEPVIIERNNTPRGPRVKRGKGNKYR